MIGPIQLLAIQFDDIDHFTGEIMRALRDLRKKGLVRVIDILFIAKDTDNELTTFTHSDLKDEELAEFGSVLGTMFGLNAPGEPADPEALVAALQMAKANFGLNYNDVQDLAKKIKPGQAAGIMLFENMWATDLRDAIHNSGGRAVMQGYLTREALTMVGAELHAVVDARQTIEAADAVKGLAILDALLTVEAAAEIEEEAMAEAAVAVAIGEEIKTAVAADVLRTLVVAGYIEEMAVQHALDTLAVAGLIEEEALESAVETSGNGQL
jgi:uncharacterized membrane protein